jgi:hypothetical protein
MLFNEESLNRLIIQPNLSETRFRDLPQQKIALFRSVIHKIKIDQCRTISKIFRDIFNKSDFPKEKDKLQAAILFSEKFEELIEIFADNEIAVSELTSLTMLRYNLFLDKATINPLAVKKHGLSKALLKLRYVSIVPQQSPHVPVVPQQSPLLVSGYLVEKSKIFTEEEQAVLNEIYSLNLLQERVGWREAHECIRLTIEEIQSLVVNFIEEIISHNFTPVTDIKLKPLPTPYTEIQDLYTQRACFNFIDQDNLAGLKECITSYPGPPQIINYHSKLSLLSYAVKLQKINFVEYLLSCGASPDLADRYGCTSLHYAFEGLDLNIVREILVASSNVDASDSFGYTPIHLATMSNQAEFVSLLLDKGANPNKQISRYRATALHYAVGNKCLPIVKILLTSHRIDLSIKDCWNRTAAEIPSSAEIKELFLQLAPNNSPVSKSPPTAASYFQHLPEKFATLGAMLLSPKQNKVNLLRIESTYKTIFNPFLTMPINQECFEETETHCNFLMEMRNQLQGELLARNKFLTLATKIKEFSKAEAHAGQVYLQILDLYREFKVEKFSFLALAFELWRNDFLNQLINLADNKSAMQVAIEHEDCFAIEQILKADPNRIQPKYLIIEDKKKLTELEFAIMQGKNLAVEVLVNAAAQNPAINLGHISSNAITLAESRKEALAEFTPACKETEYHFDLNIPDITKGNWKDLLRRLSTTLPASKSDPINGFFTQEEYPLVRVLLAEKEQDDTSLGKKLWQKLQQRDRARNLLEKRRDAAKNLYIDQEEQIAIEFALEHLNTEKLSDIVQKVQKLQTDFSIPMGHPAVEHLYQHSTKFVDSIRVSGLKTVAEVLSTGEVRVASTPLGSQYNIFFTPGGPRAELTNLRGNDPHIIKLNVTKAVKGGLLKPRDIYTSPHIPAYAISRVETPIIFRGDNSRIQTIYRLYHFSTNDRKNYKVHSFDYFEDGRSIGRHVETLEMKQEFFQGENIKLRAYFVIDFLRKIKGPFNEGSYYHYVLKNFDNLTVVESAIAAIFNVYNLEGKVSKTIDINHPAVSIVENELAKQNELLTQKAMIEILDSVKEDNPEKLAELVETMKLSYFDLGFAVENAVARQAEKMVRFLLNKGAPAYSRTDYALRESISRLQQAYSNSSDLSSIEFNRAFTIISTLLYHGSSSRHDPHHIRYAASPDNYGSISGSHTWSDKSQNDLYMLKKFLCYFKENFIHGMLLSAVTKYLEPLYNFTYEMNLTIAHSIIASRLKQPSLLESSKCLELTNKLDSGEMIDPTQFSPSTVCFIFNYAVQTGNAEVVYSFYPSYKKIIAESLKNSASEFYFNPLFTALKFNQIRIFSILLALSPRDSRNLDDIAHFAQLWKQKEAIKLLIDKGVNVKEDQLLNAIVSGELEDIAFFASRIDKRLIFSQNQSIEANTRPLVLAISKNNLAATQILLENYSGILSNQKQLYSELLAKMVMIAIEKKAPEIYRYLLETLLKIKGQKTVRVLGDLFASMVVYSDMASLSFFIDKMLLMKNKDLILVLPYAVIDSDRSFMIKLVNENNIDKLRLLRKMIPNISFRTVKLYDNQLWRSLLDRITIEMLEFLLEDKYIQDDEREKICILGQAILIGRLDIVIWCFEKLITKDFQDDRGYNILHRLSLYFAYLRSSHPMVASKAMQACIDYICLDLGIDVNHRNHHGDTLFTAHGLFNDIHNICPAPAKFFMCYIARYEHTNLNLTNNGNCILHLNFIEPWMIEKYLQQGGDVNCKNSIYHCTALEIILMSNELTEQQAVIKNMLQILSDPPRKFLSDIHLISTLKFLTISFQDKSYLLLANNSPFFSGSMKLRRQIIVDEIHYHFTDSGAVNKKVFFPIKHIELILKKPITKQLVADFKKLEPQYNWRVVELPKLNELEEIAPGIGIYQAKDPSFFIHEFFKNILELIHMTQKVQKGRTMEGSYCLPTKKYEELIALTNQFSNNLANIYAQITDDQSDDLSLGLNAIIQCQGVGFNCSILSETGYEKFHFSSVLDALMKLSKIEIAKRLFEQSGANALSTIMSSVSLQLAIKLDRLDFMKLFLQFKYMADPNDIIDCLNLIPLNRLDIVNLLASFLEIVRPTQSILKKFKEWLTNVVDENDSQQKEMEQEILAKLAPKRNPRSAKTQQNNGLSTATIASALQIKKREKPRIHGAPPLKKEKLEEQAVVSAVEMPSLPSYPSPLSNTIRPEKHPLSRSPGQIKKEPELKKPRMSN